jgi:hypothetical protein
MKPKPSPTYTLAMYQLCHILQTSLLAAKSVQVWPKHTVMHYLPPFLWALSLLRVMDSLSAFAHFGSRIQRPGYFKDTKNEEQCQY